MENLIKKACKVIAALSKLIIELISLIGWLYFLKIAITQLFN
jgi:hypothetical protein